MFLEGPFTDVGLPQIRTLKGLERLFITSDFVSEAGIAVITELPKLYRLGLDTPRFSDAGVATLTMCQNLTAIAEIRSNMTAKGGVSSVKHCQTAILTSSTNDSGIAVMTNDRQHRQRRAPTDHREE